MNSGLESQATTLEKLSHVAVIVGVLLLILAGGYRCWVWATAPSTAISIRCDEPSYNFGTGVNGTKIDHTFMLTNCGSQDITISNVNAQCGCTTIGRELRGTVLSLGQQVDLPVSLALSESNLGNVAKNISVQFKFAEQTQQVELEIQGVNEPSIYYTPERVDVTHPANSLQAVTVATVKMELHSLSESTEITVFSSPQDIRCQVIPSENKTGRAWELRIEVDATTEEQAGLIMLNSSTSGRLKSIPITVRKPKL